jgi:hypothetical protein
MGRRVVVVTRTRQRVRSCGQRAGFVSVWLQLAKGKRLYAGEAKAPVILTLPILSEADFGTQLNLRTLQDC